MIHARCCFSTRLGPALAVLCCLLSASSAGAADDDWPLEMRPEEYKMWRNGIETLALSPDGSTLAIGMTQGTVRLWDIDRGRELRRLIGIGGKPHQLSFSPDGKRIVTVSTPPNSSLIWGSNFGRPHVHPFRVWSVATGELLFTSEGILARSVVYHPSGDYLLAQVFRPSKSYWRAWKLEKFDAETFKPLGRYSDAGFEPSTLYCSHDGAFAFAQSIDHGAALTVTQDRATTAVVDARGGVRYLPPETTSPLLSPDGAYFLAYQDGNAVLFSADSLRESRRFTVPADHFSRPTGLSRYWFGRGGRSVFGVASGTVFEWSLETGDLLRTVRPIAAGAIVAHPDGRRLIGSTGNDIGVFDLEAGRTVGKFRLFGPDGVWSAETPDGYYHGAGVNVGRKYSREYSSRQERAEFAEARRSPVMVARLLAGMTVEEAEALPEEAVRPTVTARLIEPGPSAAEVAIAAELPTPGASIASLTVTVDGRAIDLGFGSEAAASDAEGTERAVVPVAPANAPVALPTSFRTTVPFPPGRNVARVRAVVTDNFGQTSEPAELTIERTIKVAPVPGRLFVLAVGVSEYANSEFNLRYPHADAEKLAGFFFAQKGRAFGDVQVKALTNDEATLNKTKEGLKWLRDSCGPGDVAVTLFSGHGVVGERGLYFLTHEANLEGLQYTCLNWEVVGTYLKDTKARQVVMLADTCHAGAFGDAVLPAGAKLAEDLRKRGGVMAFGSSRADQVSVERQAWEHGAFSYVLLEGLKGRADGFAGGGSAGGAGGVKDGAVTMRELVGFVVAEVVRLTGGAQRPSLPDLSQYDPDLVLSRPGTAAPR